MKNDQQRQALGCMELKGLLARISTNAGFVAVKQTVVKITDDLILMNFENTSIQVNNNL